MPFAGPLRGLPVNGHYIAPILFALFYSLYSTFGFLIINYKNMELLIFNKKLKIIRFFNRKDIEFSRNGKRKRTRKP